MTDNFKADTVDSVLRLGVNNKYVDSTKHVYVGNCGPLGIRDLGDNVLYDSE
jgi:hypothetical protein